MARRYFWGKDKVWLVARLADLNEEQVTGKVVTSWSAGDSSASKTLDPQLSISERLRRVLWDLSILDPVTYLPADVVKIDRMRLQVYSGVSGVP